MPSNIQNPTSKIPAPGGWPRPIDRALARIGYLLNRRGTILRELAKIERELEIIRATRLVPMTKSDTVALTTDEEKP